MSSIHGGGGTVITVLIADDHPFVRRSIADLLDRTDDIRVVAQCDDGGQVLTAVRTHRPDVALLDVRMPHTSGIEAARQVCAATDTRVVMVTGSWSPELVDAAAEAGASGFVLKGDDPRRLPGLVRDVAAGGAAWSPGAGIPTPRTPDPAPPTDREAGRVVIDEYHSE